MLRLFESGTLRVPEIPQFPCEIHQAETPLSPQHLVETLHTLQDAKTLVQETLLRLRHK